MQVCVIIVDAGCRMPELLQSCTCVMRFFEFFKRTFVVARHIAHAINYTRVIRDEYCKYENIEFMMEIQRNAS